MARTRSFHDRPRRRALAVVVCVACLSGPGANADPAADELRETARRTFDVLDRWKRDPSYELLGTNDCPHAESELGPEFHQISGLSDEAVELRALTRARLALENRSPDPESARRELEGDVALEVRRAVDARDALERRTAELEREITANTKHLESARLSLRAAEARLAQADSELALVVAEQEQHSRSSFLAATARDSLLARRVLAELPTRLVVCGESRSQPEDLARGALVELLRQSEAVLRTLQKNGLIDDSAPRELLRGLGGGAVPTASLTGKEGRLIVVLRVTIGRDATLTLLERVTAPAFVEVLADAASAERCLPRQDAERLFEDIVPRTDRSQPIEAELREKLSDLAAAEKELARIEPKRRSAEAALEAAKRDFGALLGPSAESRRVLEAKRSELARLLACSRVPAFRASRELYPADSYSLAGPALERSIREALDEARESTRGFVDRLIRARIGPFGGDARIQAIEPERTHLVVVGVEEAQDPLTRRPKLGVLLSVWSTPGVKLKSPPLVRGASGAVTSTSARASAPPLVRARPFLSEGLSALERGHFTSAISAFDACLSALDYGPCHRGLGEAYTAVRKTEHAKHHLERYLALSPYASDALEVREQIDDLTAAELPKGVTLIPAIAPIAARAPPARLGTWLLGAGGLAIGLGGAGLAVTATVLEGGVDRAETRDDLDGAKSLRDGSRALSLSAIALGSIVLASGLYLFFSEDDGIVEPRPFGP
ncbi:MAG: hypothetical protein HYV07_15175 [Deltaproteobacteria bacterium]|nr:hypothetical protein [Deltaproteobacteria bacterium]